MDYIVEWIWKLFFLIHNIVHYIFTCPLFTLLLNKNTSKWKSCLFHKVFTQESLTLYFPLGLHMLAKLGSKMSSNLRTVEFCEIFWKLFKTLVGIFFFFSCLYLKPKLNKYSIKYSTMRALLGQSLIYSKY